ncbi:hypothetical protein [Bacteroides ovatus]|uniref:hypothetical protein n=1 Tax=Bacteroides ovatus TaxID=28116 RepID=UPI001C0093DF|nr:hypothetical protein [Bacteroides ovatus]MBT9932325.1 hypothetical protein [Bacteroides ovatus]DAO14128.1 MAG TPA: hypothetical protein [Caudoviricetes sp.]
MSIELHPDIGQLDPNSLCYSIYSQLYSNFFNAQDKKDDIHPWGVVEGDDTSVRLKNTAFSFAAAISGSVAGEGGNDNGGILLGYLKKSGGDMAGVLRANYGFEAGIGNNRTFYIYKDENSSGIQINGDIRIGGNNFYLGDEKVLVYDGLTATTYIQGTYLDTGDASIHSNGDIIFGSKQSGVYISPSTVLIGSCPVYHSGNANQAAIDWKMKNGMISGDLQVTGSTTLNGILHSVHGAEFGVDGRTILYINEAGTTLSGYLSFAVGYGIKIDNIPVLIRTNKNDIQLGATGGDLLLANEHTNKIRLLAGLSDIDGDNILVSKYGAGYFPDALTVRHHYGNELLSSYRMDDTDEGIVIQRKLRFGAYNGVTLQGNKERLDFISQVKYTSPEINETAECCTGFEHGISTSLYRPLNSPSYSLFIKSDADFINTNIPLEVKGHVGIDSSLTRLTDNCLYFNSENYLLSATGGIKHYGNAYFKNSLSSEHFSSGFAGSGWAILRNETTGNVSATFDEVTVRKKMRIYEMEVQKMYTTNGSLWVSDSCSGDKVEKL